MLLYYDELGPACCVALVQTQQLSLAVQMDGHTQEMEQLQLDLERRVRVKQRQLDELEMRVEGGDEASRAIRKMHGALTQELEETQTELRRLQQGKRRRGSIASTVGEEPEWKDASRTSPTREDEEEEEEEDGEWE